jgi:hypothetical protein
LQEQLKLAEGSVPCSITLEKINKSIRYSVLRVTKGTISHPIKATCKKKAGVYTGARSQRYEVSNLY